MNAKLLLSIALFFLISSGLEALHKVSVRNHTPYAITARYHVGILGKTYDIQVAPNSQSPVYNAAPDLVKMEILGIRAVPGNKFFGGDPQFVILQDDLKAIKGRNITWDVFAETKYSGAGYTVSPMPQFVRFFLVRPFITNLPGKGGIIGQTLWFDAVTAAGATIPA